MSTEPGNTEQAKSPQDKKRFTGRCICKKVTYDVDYALPEPRVLGRCNCTVCQRLGHDPVHVSPGDFHLKTPCSTAECIDESNKHGDRLGVLTFKTSPDMHRYFCDVCGTTFLSAGVYHHNGRKYDLFAFNAKTLDQPQEGLDLSEFKYRYVDGLNDAFDKGTKDDGPWPHGSV